MTDQYDLKTLDGLRAAATDPSLAKNPTEVDEWVTTLAGTLEWAAGADEETRASREFQWRLWEQNRVAAVGQGSISVDDALDDAAFRRWFAHRSLDKCPADTAGRMEFLTGWYHDLRSRLSGGRQSGADGRFVKRTPHLKVFRVLAVLYPQAMTTVASPAALASLATTLGAEPSLGRAARHAWVRGRLDEALGSAPPDWHSQAARMVLPWLLYEKYAGQKSTGDGGPMEPWPAERRIKGLTATRGMFPGMLTTLGFIDDGVTRQELLDFLAKASPDAKRNSLGIVINGLRSEFGVVRKDGSRLTLTDSGREVLEAEDPDGLADWVLMRVLGPDWLLSRLLKSGHLTVSESTQVLQELNPGWTTGFMPNNIRAWLKSLGVIAIEDKVVSLTDRGRAWAERITWTPEALPREEPGLGPGVINREQAAATPIQVPDLPGIVAGVQAQGHFRPGHIARLHSGLWAHPRRHFAVLSGLSGAGKTLLARSYASAITGGDEGAGRRITVPVQPGWHDPGALLGFVNPLRGESYVRTPFLEFLVAAAQDPTHPHVVVLDEMNLSHPEQYMAPLLSAMETGEGIVLHTEGDTFDGVPALLPYPSNLVLIGTINMDETTHGLSDKVLDRAFVVEFWDVDLESYPRWGKTGLADGQEKAARALVGDLMNALAPVRLHFGWRVVDDVCAFLAHAASHSDVLPFEQALDDVVYAKVLPKLRGEDTPRLRTALDACIVALKSQGLVRSEAKARELREELVASGSMRFWR